MLTFALPAALTLGSTPDASAQTGAHRAHHAHQPVAARATGSGGKRGSAGAYSAHGAVASDAPAVTEFKSAHVAMMRGMDLPYTGDPDADFRIQMIPHHQGAIDMSRVAMRHAKDPWTRQLAEAVIVEQQREIAEMQAWLAQRGFAVPQAPRTPHVLTATSYRQQHEEPGTRGEARGQSWAPGGGVPAWR